MSQLVTDALAFAQTTMGHKVRKGSGYPIMVHLYSVLGIVGAYGGKDTTQAAAVLHDCPEDAGTPLEKLAIVFGKSVADIVGKLTEDKSKTWRERKTGQIEVARTCCQGLEIVHASFRVIASKSTALRRRNTTRRKQ